MISSALCIIRSSPNIEDIMFLMHDNKKLPVQATSVNFFDPKDFSDLNLDRLKELEIQRFSNLPIEMEFVKLIMAKSPALKTLRFVLNGNVSVEEELKILRDFLQLPFRRECTAKLIIDRPKPSS